MRQHISSAEQISYPSGYIIRDQRERISLKKADATHRLFSGDPSGTRTPDPLLKRQLLYRLSYRIKLFKTHSGVCGVAGTAGFEPAGEGVKVPCLTTWRRPNVERKQGTGGNPDPLCLGWVMGLEPTTPGTTIRCSAN